MLGNIISAFEKKQISKFSRASDDRFSTGDSVKVHYTIYDDKGVGRIQVFAGYVIAARKMNTYMASFVVRKTSSSSVGIERTFFLHSPLIQKIELTRRGDVRRAKLYYLRDLQGRAAKIKEKLYIPE